MAGMTDLFNLKKWERGTEKPAVTGATALKDKAVVENPLKGDGRSGRPAGRAKAAAPVVKTPNKAVAAYRTISEVAAELDVATHVLRFWEGKFPVIKPLKKSGGRRYYRPEDIALLRHIQDLLYKQGYTIKGVQTHLNKTKKRDLQQTVKSLTTAQVVREVRAVRDLLQSGLDEAAADAVLPTAETPRAAAHHR